MHDKGKCEKESIKAPTDNGVEAGNRHRLSVAYRQIQYKNGNYVA